MISADNVDQTITQNVPPTTYEFNSSGRWYTSNNWVDFKYSKHRYIRSGLKFVPSKSGVDSRTGLRAVLPVSDSHVTIWPGSHNGAHTWTNYNPVRTNRLLDFVTGYASRYNGSMPGKALITGADLGSLSDQVILDACGQMAPKASLLVDLLEIGQVIAMVTSVRGLTTELPKKLRKFNQPTTGKGIIDVLKELSGLDLMFKFGIKPLVQTCTALWEWESAVQERLNQLALRNNQEFFRISRRLARQSSFNNTVTNSFAPSVGTRSERAVVSCWASAQYNINNSTTASLTKDYFALTSLANAAWNIIPFSFVVDWAVNVGNLATAIEDRIGARVSSGNIGRAQIILPCNSLKTDCMFRSEKIVRGQGSLDGTRAWWNVRHRSFVRKTGLVNDLPIVLSTSGWNSWRTGTGAELLIQMAKFR